MTCLEIFPFCTASLPISFFQSCVHWVWFDMIAHSLNYKRLFANLALAPLPLWEDRRPDPRKLPYSAIACTRDTEGAMLYPLRLSLWLDSFVKKKKKKTALAEELLIHPMDRDISASLFVCCKLALKCINRELFSGEEKPILSPIYPLSGENFLLSLYPPTEH